jgi:signal peptidase I
VVIAVLIALTIRAYIVEPFRIPSGSMLPTLLIGDHLFVNKFVYGPKIPFTDVRLPGLREPERGDVIVFTVARRGGETFPADRHPELSREEFVKRIVGLPGDRVEFRNGRVFVNGEEMHVEPLSETFRDATGRDLGAP